MIRFLILILSVFCCSLAQAQDLFIDDPATLEQLENQGFDFPRLVLKEEKPIANNQLLTKNQVYSEMVKSLAADLTENKKNDPKLFISMRGSHRLFDAVWLISDYARFELAGIVQRADRLAFDENHCGEIRLIYRLSYETQKSQAVYSRLPMTINAVFWSLKEANSCQNVVKKWKTFRSTIENGNTKKLSPVDLSLNQLKSIEVNMQSVRWPSTIRPDMAGYAEYLLRVFSIQNNKAILAKLENTPNVELLSQNPQLKNDLLNWLIQKQNLENIDAGIVKIPDRFLTDKAMSVALHGVHRLQNAPFTQIFKESDFKPVDFSNTNSFKTANGLLRRLNDLSCVGCHQGRTVAGFHFLGKDKAKIDFVNSIFISSSPHFLLDQKRRLNFVADLENGKKPNYARPLSVRAEKDEGLTGSHCGLKDGDKSFSSWTCEPGFECQAMTLDKKVSPTGICVPVKKISGSPCISGEMVHHTNSKKDGIKKSQELSCGTGYVCEASSVGFPNGMCAGSCDRLKSGENCGAIAELFGFNNCLANGKTPFAKCLSENVGPASLQACDQKNFCRDDYICARTSEGKGACIPPYFLFQLRVDGHPSPGLGQEKFTFLDRLRKLLPDE